MKTDQELNRLVAEKVSGWRWTHTHMPALYPPNLPPEANCFGHSPPDYCNDANSVLGLLENLKNHDWLTRIQIYNVWRVCLIHTKINGQEIHAQAPTFPKAAVLALLRAYGVEVEG